MKFYVFHKNVSAASEQQCGERAQVCISTVKSCGLKKSRPLESGSVFVIEIYVDPGVWLARDSEDSQQLVLFLDPVSEPALLSPRNTLSSWEPDAQSGRLGVHDSGCGCALGPRPPGISWDADFYPLIGGIRVEGLKL